VSLRKSPVRTPALLAANRRNAQKCTGPKTARGKARSSLNALQHGQYAQDLPAKLRRAGIRNLGRVDSFRKIMSRIYRGKSGKVLLESGANTLAMRIWRENKIVRLPPQRLPQDGSGNPTAFAGALELETATRRGTSDPARAERLAEDSTFTDDFLEQVRRVLAESAKGKEQS